MNQLTMPILDPNEATEGYTAVLKSDVNNEVNICRSCDWRTNCTGAVRCMSYTVITPRGAEPTRKDGCSVVFKKKP